MKIIGRKNETELIQKTLKLFRNILIEGPVGVGKTFLVTKILDDLKLKYERVDGDTRYTEQKLAGWFDPPLVLKKGYHKDCFIEGPLLRAMREGKVLFINELNRMPEAVQNILLPAMDEHKVVVPRLGAVEAKKGFCVIATQNPREFTATHSLSEALLDRFEMVHLDYQSRDEELAILKQELGAASASWESALDLVRATRDHEAIKRGASVRAVIAIADLMRGGLGFEEACLMALPSRIEMASSDQNAITVIRQLLASLGSGEKKKAARPLETLSPQISEPPVFFPPELNPQIDNEDVSELEEGKAGAELKTIFLRQTRSQQHQPTPNHALVKRVLAQAREIIAHPSKPLVRRWVPWSESPWGEFDLEASLEESPDLTEFESLLVEEMVPKRFDCVAMLDTSFSMAGEKHLLSSLAVAVLLLEVPSVDTSVVAFGSEAKVIKTLGAEERAEQTVKRFLEWQPKGFTNIAAALEQGLGQLRRRRKQKRSVGILVTDGRATEGEDPFQVAKKFDYLLVLHLHGPASHRDASIELAQKGNGTCLEVESLDQLPRRLYDAIRTISRL